MQTSCSHPRSNPPPTRMPPPPLSLVAHQGLRMTFQETKLWNRSLPWTMPAVHPHRSIWSSKHLKSSFYRMASARKKSRTSLQSMVLAPSSGALSINVRRLVQYLGSKDQLSKAKILDMTTYQCQLNLRHMFIVLRLRRGPTESWLRLDRRAEDPLSTSFIFFDMEGPAKDVVRQIYSLDLRTT